MAIVPTKEVIVVASGGGSGFEQLVQNQAASGAIGCPYRVVALVATRPDAGAIGRAKRLEVPHYVWQRAPGVKWTATGLYELVGRQLPVMLSGCNVIIEGFEPDDAINIHPASTELRDGQRPFAGLGMYGLRVHEFVLAAYRRGEITETAVTIHRVVDEPDAGDVLDCTSVPIEPHDTPELQRRVNEVEHGQQWEVMARWLHGQYDTAPRSTTRVLSNPGVH